MSARKGATWGGMCIEPCFASQSAVESEGGVEMEGDRVGLLREDARGAEGREDADGGVYISKAKQDEVVRRVSWNILPVTFLMTFICFVDRTNLGLAADSFCHDLGITSSQYGTGVGLLFIGYALFQIPSNIVLHYVGAPLWLGVILISWGVCALSMAFVTNVHGFYVVRFLLGAAESGAFPGLWYYYTHFFPENRITVPYTVSELGVKSSQVISAPIAAGFLAMGGLLGYRDWQWLFLMEGLPPVILGVYIWWTFPACPEKAPYLTEEEGIWLSREIKIQASVEDQFQNRHGLMVIWNQFKMAIKVRDLWAMTLLKGLKDLSVNVSLFWTPLIIETLLEGHSLSHLPEAKTCSASGDGNGKHKDITVALLTAIPFSVAMVVGITNGWHSQRVGERKLHMSFVFMTGAVIFGVMPWVTEIAPPYSVIVGIVCLTGAVAGSLSAQGIMISLVTTFSGPSKAIGLALFNSLSNLAGYFGPQFTGWILGTWGSYKPAIVALAIALFLAGVVGLCVTDPHDKNKIRFTKERKEDI